MSRPSAGTKPFGTLAPGESKTLKILPELPTDGKGLWFTPPDGVGIEDVQCPNGSTYLVSVRNNTGAPVTGALEWETQTPEAED